MYKRLMLLFTIFVLMTSGCSAKDEPIEKETNLQGDFVQVYYFYNDFRCVSCLRIENYTKEALDENFGKEIGSGKIVFKTINVDKNENKHFIKDYQLYTKSVIVSLVRDGKETKYENLQNVWKYLGDKNKFSEYIKDKLDKYLGELG